MFCSVEILELSLWATITDADMELTVENISIAVAINIGPLITNLFSRTRDLCHTSIKSLRKNYFPFIPSPVVQLCPLWQRLMDSADEEWLGTSQYLSIDDRVWCKVIIAVSVESMLRAAI